MTPRLIVVFAFTIGLGLFLYSLTMPYYKEQMAVDSLQNSLYKIDEKKYYEREEKFRTSKLDFMDLGAGVAIASGVILLFLLLTKTKTLADLKKIKTFNKSTLFISANLVWLLLIPGTIWYYVFRSLRGDYPPFADTISIPIFAQIPVLLLSLIPLNIFIILTTINARLPTRIFVKPANYNRSAILWELFFGFWLLINLLCFFVFVVGGDHISILVNLFFTFVLLCLRAGQISKYIHMPEIS